jgi:hypothetical protein
VLEDIALVLEVSVKRPVSDAETLGYVRYTGLMIAALRKFYEGSIDYFSP